jgi:hypothetical protein
LFLEPQAPDVACAAKFPNTSWLLSDNVLGLIEYSAAADWVGMVVTDPALVARRGCADVGVAVVATDVAELCEEADVSGALDVAEALDDADGFNVKTTLLDALLPLLLMIIVVPAMDALETEDAVMIETSEVLPMPSVPADTTL